MRAGITAGLVSTIVLAFCSSLAAQTAPPIYLFSLEDKGVPTGTVHAYGVNSSSGELTEAPGSPFNAGLIPIQLAVDPSGRFVYVLNLQSDDMTAFSVDASTGTLTPLPGSPFPMGSQRPGQQPISFSIDPTGRFLYVSTDTNISGVAPSYDVYQYTIDGVTGVLAAAASSPVIEGIWVASISFNPGGNLAYVSQSGTIGSSQPILVYSVDFTSGLLTPVGSVQPGAADAESIVDPSGKFLYWIEPSAPQIAAFTISSQSGLATEVSGSPYPIGSAPSHLAINPEGRFLYVSQVEGISALFIDSGSGALTPVSGSPFAAGINPNFIVMDPSAKYAYVPSTTTTAGGVSFAQILGYSIDASSGVLTPLSGMPWTDAEAYSNGYQLAVSYASSEKPNPVPMISSISPLSVTAGGAGFALQVNGANFVPGATVYFGGQGRKTTFVNSTQLNADILDSDIANGGTAVVFVFNPLPGGGPSTSVELTVLNPSPAITSINPSSVTAAGTGFTLTVSGSGFVAGSTVNFNGAGLPTTYISSTQLTAPISGNVNAVQGTYAITVTNAANGVAGGGTSNSVMLTISPVNVQPTVSRILPPSATAGGAGFTLTVNGSGFVQGSQVSFNLNNVSTTFVSATQLTASIPPSAIATAGNPYVIVTNPGGLVSVLVTFTVNNPQPTGGTVSPPSLPAGSNALTLSVTGTGFVSGSAVLVNGTPRTTTFTNSTLLQATLLPSDLAQGGTLDITVMTPPPGGGTTSAISFAVADYAVSAPSSSPTVTAGQTANFGLTVSPSNGTFSNPVSFSASALPSGATASFTPSATITPGSSPAPVTLSINTTAHSVAIIPVNPLKPLPMLPPPVEWLVAIVILLGIGLREVRPRAERSVPKFALASLLLVAGGLTACGGAVGTTSEQQLNPATGTPAGTYSIVVTATSGTAVHSTNVTLMVM